ncbi:hypothetical protein SUDANB120_06443 (plasmid) [Streptomyces sp. enrichment culture]|uniref:hypothetical protein n=1 Tax=Streptomyces sp. enrichment culture TaxID=1795815 RepID=UPI003F57C7F0
MPGVPDGVAFRRIGAAAGPASDVAAAVDDDDVTGLRGRAGGRAGGAGSAQAAAGAELPRAGGSDADA